MKRKESNRIGPSFLSRCCVMRHPPPYFLGSENILTGSLKLCPCMSVTYAALSLMSSNDSCSEVPHCHSTSPISRDMGRAISENFLTHLRVIPVLPINRRSPVESVGTGNSVMHHVLSCFVLSLPPISCSRPRATILSMNKLSFLNDSLSLDHRRRGNKWILRNT